MTKTAVRDLIEESLWEYQDLQDWDNIENITTFEEDGILTHDAGLTVEMKDGSKYQVTVVEVN